MKRRHFLAAAAAAGSTAAAVSAGPLAGHVAHAALPHRRPPSPAAGRGRSSGTHRPRGTLLRVRLSDVPTGWRPKSWRDVPPAPFAVCQTVAGQSLAACRLAAKRHNQEQLRTGVCSWLVVATTDGRFAKGDEA
jgi:hypothetical protein